LVEYNLKRLYSNTYFSDKEALTIREKWDKCVASKKYHQQSEQFRYENDEMAFIFLQYLVEYFTQKKKLRLVLVIKKNLVKIMKDE
jgi:hypothetical protein